eukprot:TRINITY_DN8264_c0_g2_i1.p1 TRINITY_DN8264_c0_g2~~TRINITY_DN8264_c0_g2_i1.p1  ORF type:complete len:340 (-),score=48.64 TRINITY_DN8264_c0_g2_i1:120-1139(-)
MVQRQRVPPLRRSECCNGVVRSATSLLVAIIVSCFLGYCPSAFYTSDSRQARYTAPGGIDTSSNAQGSTRESIFKGPKFLKVLLDPYVMHVPDLGNYEQIAFLEQQTNTRIQISPKGDWYQHDGVTRKVMTISGTADDILAAFSMLRKTKEVDRYTFLIPQASVGKMLGSNGDKVRDMQSKTSALIGFFEVRKMVEAKVMVRGSPKAVDEVAGWLLQEQEDLDKDWLASISGRYTPERSDYDVEIFVKLTPDQSKQVMGPRASTIRSLEKQFFVQLQFDKERRDGTLSVSGCIGDVHAALRYLMESFVLPKRTSATNEGRASENNEIEENNEFEEISSS